MILALLATAAAESWCAGPLVAHEWGVTTLYPAGGTSDAAPLPAHFHTAGEGARSASIPVRTLPADSGERDLPVLHLYAASPWEDRVPVGLEVGFTHGAASAWFPAVHTLRPASEANSPAAHLARTRLVAARQARAKDPFGEHADPGPDPTRQLGWDALLALTSPSTPPHPTDHAWVERARAIPGALWINGPGESERFVFYEGRTREASAIVVERVESEHADHFQLRNTSDWDVHDVVFVHDGRAWRAPRIPAGKTAGFLLRDPYDADETRAWLTGRWTDDRGVPETDWEECVMMRDPAVPAEAASDHRLYPPELDVLWTAWADRLLAGDGTRLLYREDPAALDAAMPLSLYTDMYHDPRISRLGVVRVIDPPVP